VATPKVARLRGGGRGWVRGSEWVEQNEPLAQPEFEGFPGRSARSPVFARCRLSRCSFVTPETPENRLQNLGTGRKPEGKVPPIHAFRPWREHVEFKGWDRGAHTGVSGDVEFFRFAGRGRCKPRPRALSPARSPTVSLDNFDIPPPDESPRSAGAPSADRPPPFHLPSVGHCPMPASARDPLQNVFRPPRASPAHPRRPILHRCALPGRPTPDDTPAMNYGSGWALEKFGTGAVHAPTLSSRLTIKEPVLNGDTEAQLSGENLPFPIWLLGFADIRF